MADEIVTRLRDWQAERVLSLQEIEDKGMEHECWRCRRPFIAISGQPEK